MSAIGRRPSKFDGRKAEGRGTAGECATFTEPRESSFHDDVQNLAGNEDDTLDRLALQVRRGLGILVRELQGDFLRGANRHELVAAVFAVYLEHEFHFGADELARIVRGPRSRHD